MTLDWVQSKKHSTLYPIMYLVYNLIQMLGPNSIPQISNTLETEQLTDRKPSKITTNTYSLKGENREVNADRVFAQNGTIGVFDGVSSMTGASTASEICYQKLRDLTPNLPTQAENGREVEEKIVKPLESMLFQANAEIQALEQKGGTTASIAHVVEVGGKRGAVVVYAGDSRVAKYNPQTGELTTITIPDNPALRKLRSNPDLKDGLDNIEYHFASQTPELQVYGAFSNVLDNGVGKLRQVHAAFTPLEEGELIIVMSDGANLPTQQLKLVLGDINPETAAKGIVDEADSTYKAKKQKRTQIPEGEGFIRGIYGNEDDRSVVVLRNGIDSRSYTGVLGFLSAKYPDLMKAKSAIDRFIQSPKGSDESKSAIEEILDSVEDQEEGLAEIGDLIKKLHNTRSSLLSKYNKAKEKGDQYNAFEEDSGLNNIEDLVYLLGVVPSSAYPEGMQAPKLIQQIETVLDESTDINHATKLLRGIPSALGIRNAVHKLKIKRSTNIRVKG